MVVALLSLSALSLFALLQTRYATDTVNLLFKHLTPYHLVTQKVRYTPPLQLELDDVEIQSEPRNVRIPKLTLWLNPYLLNNGKVAFDSMLIEGANIDLQHFDLTLLKPFYLNHLALDYVDVSSHDWSARGVSLQVKQPVWQDDEQTLPYGDIQLSAKQLYTRGEALDNLLIDAKYQAADSTLYGMSFNWRGANVSGQAEQYESGWSLVNVTVNQLQLTSATPAEQLLTTLDSLSLPITHINSLDILSSSFDYAGWRFEQLDASLENLSLERSLWQQQQGYLSFNADSVTYQDLQLIAPTAKLAVSDKGITFDDFDADFKEGRIQLEGRISPSDVQLKQLRMSGIKWLENTSELVSSLHQAAQSLNTLSIDELDVNNGQIIQIERKPYWQLSGVNIEGEQLSLIKGGKAGFFNGHLEVTANNASLDQLLTTQAMIRASSQQGDVRLERAFLPLPSGYIEANGKWDQTTLSAPWAFSLHGDGIPLEQAWIQSRLPFSLSGLAEIELDLSGLSGDYSMLAHSASGKVKAQIRQGMIDAKSADGEVSFMQPWPLEVIEVNADRGRIRIQSQAEKGALVGQLDLTKPQFGTLILNINQACQQLWSEVFDLTNVISQVCPKADVDQPISDDHTVSSPSNLDL